MMRVRTDGALLGAEQLRALGEVSTDVRPRHRGHHRPAEHPVPLDPDRGRPGDLGAAGVGRAETRWRPAATPRGPFLGSPVAGVAADEIIDGTPALEEIKRRFIGDPEYANLPRKFKTTSRGHPSLDVAPEVNDVSFVGTVHPEHGPGFDLWVGGGLSTNPMLAQKLGVWVPLEEVADVWEGVMWIFRDYGYRRLRNRARLKFLVADWGVEKFRQVLEDEYLHRPLLDGPSPASPERSGDHIGVHQQKDGDYYVGVAPSSAGCRGTVLSALGDLVERYGAAGVRLTAYQKLRRPRGPSEASRRSWPTSRPIGLSARPSVWRRATMACTGIEYCKLAIVETKERASGSSTELERRFPDLDTPITVNVNGCPNSCARTQVADIGLKGQLVMGADGRQVEGFQVHLGGGIGLAAQHTGTPFGRKLRAHKVTSAGLDDYITHVVDAFLADRHDGEAFAAWVAAGRRGRAARREGASKGHGGGHERAHVALPLPLLRRRGPAAARGRSRHLGVPVVHACVQREVPRPAAAHRRSRRHREVAHDRRRHRPALPGPWHRHRRSQRAGAARPGPARRRGARAGPGRGDHGVGRGDLRRALLRSPPRWGTRCWRTSPPGWRPGIDVVFLDTGYHFAETIGTRDAVAATLPVNLLTITPKQTVAEQDAEFGKDLFARDPDLCCAMRKVAPLAESLAGYDAWATGLRRAETHNRVIAPVIGWDARKRKVKVSPLARWSDEQVDRYVLENGVLVNPLQYDGYPSIGCGPCTRRVAPGEDPRSGRWAGTGKTECGIHADPSWPDPPPAPGRHTRVTDWPTIDPYRPERRLIR